MCIYIMHVREFGESGAVLITLSFDGWISPFINNGFAHSRGSEGDLIHKYLSTRE